MTPPRIRAVVLGYGSRMDVSAALSSLSSSTVPAEVVLVQNGLPDSDIEELETTHPGIHTIRNRGNIGVSAGRNQAIQLSLAAGATHMFFLDRDARVSPDAIRVLMEALADIPDAGMLSCMIFTGEGKSTVHSAGASFDPSDIQDIHFRFVPRDPILNVPFVSTTATLVTREYVERVGLFDERYFAYFEDFDWAERGTRLGYRHFIASNAVAYHDEERSRYHPLIVFYITRNRFLFARSHGYVNSSHDWKVVRRAWREAGVHIRSVFGLRPLAFTCLVAYVSGCGAFLLGRFGKAPGWMAKPAERFREERLRRWFLGSSVFALLRSFDGKSRKS